MNSNAQAATFTVMQKTRATLRLVFLLATALAASDLQPFVMPWADVSTGITNLQDWQPTPAGFGGWVSVSPAGHYVINGKPIRFLGVNLAGSFAIPSHAHAEAHAARLARFGFNAVRLHLLDSPWEKDSVVIDYASGSSRNLSADRLDKLHYLVAQLASRGIYSDLNLLTAREFQPSDGLGPEISQLGIKQQQALGFFDADALALHEEFAAKLLTAPNPYRQGVPLGLDPAVAFVEIMNENGLYETWLEGGLDHLPDRYLQTLSLQWNRWLSAKYADDDALLARWAASPFPDGISLAKGNIPLLQHSSADSSCSAGEKADWAAFLLSLENRYWNTVYQYLKDTLKYPGIVWATAIGASPPNAVSGMDATDTHAYWQFPVWPPGQDWSTTSWSIPNTSMVNDPGGGTIAVIARQRVRGKPHNVSEYQHPSPNSFAAEGPLLVAAYASLQDWDGLWFFDYETGEDEFVTGFSNHGAHPARMANNLLAAALFRRGDAKVSTTEFTYPFPSAKEAEIASAAGVAGSVADGSHLGVPAALGLTSRVDLAVGTDTTSSPQPAPPSTTAIKVSDTGELTWDNSRPASGIVTVNTTRTKAVAGFADGRTLSLGGVRIAPGATRTGWCTVGISLIEGTSFGSDDGGKALLVATGMVENTSQKWTDAGHTSVGADWGNAPTLIEVVPASVILPVPAARVSAWALDGKGQRASPLSIVDQNGNALLTLGANGTTLWYEIQIAPVQPNNPSTPTNPNSNVETSGSGGGGAPGAWYVFALCSSGLLRFYHRRLQRR